MTDAREQWNGIWGARAHPTVEPDPWIEEIASLLPDRGRAIDLAGGAGAPAPFRGPSSFRAPLAGPAPPWGFFAAPFGGGEPPSSAAEPSSRRGPPGRV